MTGMSAGVIRLILGLIVGSGLAWSYPAECEIAAEIIAHRGASHDAPENTLASVNLAWEQQADAVEIDVYLSKDGQIVAIHDETTERTAGLKRNVADQTLNELKALDAGRWKGERWAGEPIPTLAEILATVPDGKRLLIEVKCGVEILPELQRVLRRSGKRDRQTAIISFSEEVVEAAKTALPKLQVYWITKQEKDERTGAWMPPVDTLIERARRIGADGLDVRAVPIIDSQYVGTIKQAGLEIYVWTVNSPDDAERLESAGVDGITTDRPKLLQSNRLKNGP